MKIFIIGLPRSGRTTVSKELVSAHGWEYIDAMSWIRSTFRSQHEGEHHEQYEDEYHHYLAKKLTAHPNMVIDHVQKMMDTNNGDVFVIDGIVSPKDFAALFDFGHDIVVFLNRTDNEYHFRDHENIGVSVIRDYCFWMSSIALLDRRRWLEYNFRVDGNEPDFVKEMGARNTVLIVKPASRVISHAIDKLKGLVDAVPQ
jgi:hypothetical protein